MNGIYLHTVVIFLYLTFYSNSPEMYSRMPTYWCARGWIPRLSDGTSSDKAGGKATLCGYATEQTTKTSPKDP